MDRDDPAENPTPRPARVKVRHIPFSADEFLVGVTGMPPFDVGVYWVICSLMYSSGGPIPLDDERLFRILKAKPKHIKDAVERLVAKGKFRVSTRTQLGANLVSTRTELELNRASARIEQAVKNLKNNGLEDPDRVTDALTNNYKPITDSSEASASSESGGAAKEPPPSFALKPVEPPPAKAKRATRLPDEWRPSDADRVFATGLGLNPDAIADSFGDYWRAKAGKDAAKLDWSATYRNWCRRDAERGGGARAPRATDAWGASMRRSMEDAASLIDRNDTQSESGPWPRLTDASEN